jgi:hypothetical protein
MDSVDAILSSHVLAAAYCSVRPAESNIARDKHCFGRRNAPFKMLFDIAMQCIENEPLVPLVAGFRVPEKHIGEVNPRKEQTFFGGFFGRRRFGRDAGANRFFCCIGWGDEIRAFEQRTKFGRGVGEGFFDCHHVYLR